MKHDAGFLPEVDVSRETHERLRTFLGMVERWSGTLNLVARGDLPTLWQRHIIDSLQLLPLVPQTGALIDLGSGAGFPGLVLAIACDRPFHLVESDQRKAAFLREAARVAAATVHIHACRIDSARLPPARLITARALASLPRLAAWASPILEPGGYCLFMKGRTIEAELTQTQAEWTMHIRRWQSRTDPDADILQISELSRHAVRSG